ncbi:YxeA family protein [Lentilactobacillus sp. SPB1-3]|uniref:YxeA family protein n=1 Tax=Lentilactobacillus terminaliae TaxID=3003483 RepID=A0ACD5DG56_9LACO|nr:YxeA family protein [Lentilactobacillus sp. SPB1-3]MCZ0976638.1 YxeA family protein [Lentilactobacillus sp. SPB1-3]
MGRYSSWLIGILIVAILGFGTLYYQNMARDYYYGQVGELANVDARKGNHNPDVYWYNIKGYDRQGNFRELHVGSYQGHKFTKGRYLKIGWSQHKGVIDYKRVDRDQIPDKALKKIDQHK